MFDHLTAEQVRPYLEIIADEVNVENVVVGKWHYQRACPWHTPAQTEKLEELRDDE